VHEISVRLINRDFLWDVGQVYFALLQEREDKGIKDVAISRIEQLSPFPYDIVSTFRFVRASY
jgi:hypothetical protein